MPFVEHCLGHLTNIITDFDHVLQHYPNSRLPLLECPIFKTFSALLQTMNAFIRIRKSIDIVPEQYDIIMSYIAHNLLGVGKNPARPMCMSFEHGTLHYIIKVLTVLSHSGIIRSNLLDSFTSWNMLLLFNLVKHFTPEPKYCVCPWGFKFIVF